ncbi:hypothetical protein PSI22_20420 [Xenorhabdus sp. XENO-7]|uniref:Transposase n=1 Tax=Xenorhabdus aichiensis TaxID=3025874 RepID=A0ABT5MAB7_9GAMM|nr:hypothetical protein [Xenorhabdus aichiensis]
MQVNRGLCRYISNPDHTIHPCLNEPWQDEKENQDTSTNNSPYSRSRQNDFFASCHIPPLDLLSQQQLPPESSRVYATTCTHRNSLSRCVHVVA